jgi:molecular chaperone DnaK (HSP70)
MYGAEVNPAAAPVGYGIDFGTSNSAISVAYADRVEVLALGPSRSAMTLPSFVIRSELDLVGEAIGRALDEARIQATDVERVLLTGGSAYIPAFRDDLARIFGEDRLEQRDAFTAVVHGLGIRAQQLWGL